MRLCEGRKQEQPSERNVAEEAQHHEVCALFWRSARLPDEFEEKKLAIEKFVVIATTARPKLFSAIVSPTQPAESADTAALGGLKARRR